MAVKLEIGLKAHLFDPEGANLCRKIRDYFGWEVREARVIHVLTLDADLSDREMEIIRRDIFTNPVTQESSFETLAADFDWAIWVGFRPGVRDTAGSVAIEAISDTLGRTLGPRESAYTSKLFLLRGSSLEKWQAETVARELLANDIIQQWRVAQGSQWDPREGMGIILPKVFLAQEPSVAEIPIPSDDSLARLSRERNLALNPRDIPVIRDYFMREEVLRRRREVGLSVPTDVELEAISQARSDHCNHNTFQGRFHYEDLSTGERETIDSLFKTCIEAPTLAIQEAKDWVVSVLWDNAGVARFDEDNNYAITGETHNSPSNMEAYGGALTGIVGIYRDIMGTGKGARLLAGLYGYCVGPRGYTGPLRPHLHPRRLLDGVVEGVRDGGNKHGVPTPFGNLFHHPSYLGKCLVFVASLGIMPREIDGERTDEKCPEPGDWILMCGGRVGKDGIHGVTASSETYSEHTPAGN
ncbi:MAG: phosphoribosylformylglycinamidine synthase, partial [Syntrophobacteraceae bacterium]|nr:phosphoribosylformylglycinamidine synthase [Syntrophobacteraceae bacterium]